MTLAKAAEALKKYFGYDKFRPMQADVIQSVYDKKDGVVIIPTGGGKSVCFQIPGITMDGMCIVISPLIALMKDQVEGLIANGVKAGYLNSSQTGKEQVAIEDAALTGNLDLLYVSPEKLLSGSFLPIMKDLKIAMFAIDEAHCISSWGHDFRPEYTKLKFIKMKYPNTPMLALTATADKITRRDIIKQLGLNEPQTFLASFDRPNLSLAVRPGRKRFEQIVEFIRERKGQSGIIYCLSRKSTESMADKLQRKGIKAKFYHAKMDREARSLAQDDFITDKVPIICATIAFGMGIDKSNVRWVMHYNLPKSIESYYQEIGRAGRDGIKSDTLLFYSFADYNMLRDMLSNGGKVELKVSKLDRMKQYAESLVCRRQVLLHYFGEHTTKNCGNCDVCLNPPTHFDGTVLAQKALSATLRLKEKASMSMVIDVLRGSKRKEIIDRGYHNIKTYGAGAMHSVQDWFYYMQQMLNLGLIEIAYDQGNAVQTTEASKEILFEGKKVKMVRMVDVRKNQEKKVKPKTKKQIVREELFDIFKALRLKIARQKNMAPYLVFTDATLEEMAVEKPTNMAEMAQISGVGVKKLRMYGEMFINVVLEYVMEKAKGGGKAIRGTTYIVTGQYVKKGLSVEQIAQERGLSTMTIFSHLAQLYKNGEKINLGRYISKVEGKEILDAIRHLDPKLDMKDIHSYLDERIEFHKIRLMLAYYERHKSQLTK